MFFQRYSPGQVVFEISGIVYTQVQIEDQACNKGFKTVLSRLFRFVMNVRLISLTFLR